MGLANSGQQHCVFIIKETLASRAESGKVGYSNKSFSRKFVDICANPESIYELCPSVVQITTAVELLIRSTRSSFLYVLCFDHLRVQMPSVVQQGACSIPPAAQPRSTFYAQRIHRSAIS